MKTIVDFLGFVEVTGLDAGAGCDVGLEVTLADVGAAGVDVFAGDPAAGFEVTGVVGAATFGAVVVVGLLPAVVAVAVGVA